MVLVTRQTIENDTGTFADGTVEDEDFFAQFYDQIDDQVHSTTNPTIKPKATTDEVVAARGNAASLDARISGVIDDDGNIVDNVVQILTTDATTTGNVGTGEDTLFQYSIPANTLNTNGQAIRFRAFGATANNANTKTLKVYFGATAFGSHVLTANSSALWCMQGDIVRGAPTVQYGREVTTHTLTAPTSPVGGATAAETLTGAVILKITGESNAASNNDITINFIIVEILK